MFVWLLWAGPRAARGKITAVHLTAWIMCDFDSIYIIYKFGREPHYSRDAGWRSMVYTIASQCIMLCLKNLKRIHRELSRYFVVRSHGEIPGCLIGRLKVQFRDILWGVSVNYIDMFSLFYKITEERQWEDDIRLKIGKCRPVQGVIVLALSLVTFPCKLPPFLNLQSALLCWTDWVDYAICYV